MAQPMELVIEPGGGGHRGQFVERAVDIASPERDRVLEDTRLADTRRILLADEPHDDAGQRFDEIALDLPAESGEGAVVLHDEDAAGAAGVVSCAFPVPSPAPTRALI